MTNEDLKIVVRLLCNLKQDLNDMKDEIMGLKNKIDIAFDSFNRVKVCIDEILLEDLNK